MSVNIINFVFTLFEKMKIIIKYILTEPDHGSYTCRYADIKLLKCTLVLYIYNIIQLFLL